MLFLFYGCMLVGNGKNMPSLLAKGRFFHVLQEVPALSPVPSALTKAEETLHE